MDRGELIQAVLSGDADRVRSLLLQGADPNASSSFGKTALMFAAWKAFPEIVQLLVDAGARADVRDRWGWSVQDWADKGRDPEALRQILEVSRGPEP